MSKTAAVPVIEWRVLTKDNRNMVWSCPDDLNYLLRDLAHYGHVPIHIEKYQEYEARKLAEWRESMFQREVS